MTLLQMSYRMDLDRDNRIESFEEIGLADPYKTKESLRDAISICRTFDFYTEVYPDQVMTSIMAAVASGSIKPPKCIFVPS